MVEMAIQILGKKMNFSINGEETVDYTYGKNEFGPYSIPCLKISFHWIKDLYKKNKFASSSFQGYAFFFTFYHF